MILIVVIILMLMNRKERFTMTIIHRDEVERLYSIIDNTIGFFRTNDMPEKAQKFYNDKHQEFLNSFKEEIPERIWFQGTICPSAELLFDSIQGFHIITDSTDHKVKELVKKVNEKLQSEKFQLELEESSTK